MTLFDPDPELRWLFCFTHPDDEISICAWIKRLTSSGANVWAGWSVSNPVRESEARQVMKMLDVPQKRLRYYGKPDKGACDHLPELVSDWAEFIDEVRPSRIAIGAFECGHIDHDATNFAVSHALRLTNHVSSPLLEIPWYHTYLTRVPVLGRFADPTGEEVLTLGDEERRLKWRVARMYPSQNIASLLVWYTALTWAKFRTIDLRRTERMRLQAHFDYFRPNLPSTLARKVEKSETWARWVNAIERYEARL